MLSNITCGNEMDEKEKNKLEILKTNFTFAFNDDNTFMSDFINDQDPTTPFDVKGDYQITGNKMELKNLTINGKPNAQQMLYNIDFKDGQLLLLHRQPGVKDLVMSFKKTSTNN